jgi:tetratricopeptide (TPR) repeat protein
VRQKELTKIFAKPIKLFSRFPGFRCLLLGLMMAVPATAQTQIDSVRMVLEGMVKQESSNWQARLQLSDIYSATEQYEEAVKLMEEVIQLIPDSSFAHMRMGNMYYSGKNMDGAVQAFRRVTELSPGQSSEAFHGLSRAYSELERFADATAAINEALKQDSDNYAFLGTKGLVLLYQEQFADASEAYARALSINPMFVDAYNQWARCLTAQGELEAAAQALKQALQINPLILNAWFDLGIVRMMQGQYDQATEAFTNVAELDAETSALYYIEHLNSTDWDMLEVSPATLEAAFAQHSALRQAYGDSYKALGITYFTHGTLNQQPALIQRAEQVLIEIKNIVPQDATIANHLGYTYFLQQRLDAAEVEFTEALSLKPDFADAQNNLGLMLKSQGRLDEAEAAYKKALDMQEDFFGAYGNLGILFLDQNKAQEAVKMFEKAIAIKPNYVEGYDGLASAWFLQRDITKGREVLERLLYVDPSRVTTYQQLGEAAMAQQDYEEARQYFRSAFRIEPREENAYIGMGMAYLQERMLEEAILSFGMAVRVNPQSTNPRLAQAYMGIGGIYLENQNLRQAEIFLQRSFFFSKSLPEVHYMLGSLYAATGREKEARDEFELESQISGGVPAAKQRIIEMEEVIAANSSEVATGKYRLRHILVPTATQVDTVLDELQRGKEFVYVAIERSTDVTAQRGGDTGYLAKGDLSEAMEAAVLPLKVGDYTRSPVESAKGFHMFQRIE